QAPGRLAYTQTGSPKALSRLFAEMRILRDSKEDERIGASRRNIYQAEYCVCQYGVIRSI
ncbi:MAG: hypothetical protein U5K69_26310, partial [Balneolaceae bacterium]|nr:hypothetical protein [Balneolaceae bacterium]